MQKIIDEHKLNYYINKYNIRDIFATDMTPYMELCIFDRNEYICKSKEDLDYFYFLVHGKTKVYLLLKNGKSLLLRFYKPLSVIGDVEIVKDSHTSSNIQVVEKALCIRISMKNLRRFAINDTCFLRYIINSLGDKLEKNSRANSINLLYPLENRLASYLLAISSSDEASSDISGISTYKLTEIADLLGTSYRHLHRTINKLCNEGFIKKDNQSLVILDYDSLEKLAGDIYE
ncbi:transcriptional regulator YeiL [Clostridium malenominatum]|uniref:Transcriptional regulator YeiL n=1 Tax=Clostridium malenominatum TaxID=1539 RepID=A0ABN1IM80_9CLOT